MSIRGHGNAVAIALAGLAVVIAATGTAVAITATQVNIVDPTTPSNVAHVDSSGRLTTLGVTSTLNTFDLIQFTSGDTLRYALVTSPATATLAVTAVRVSNSATSSATYEASLFQSKLSGKSCEPGAVLRFYSDETLRPNDEREHLYPAPLIIKTPAGEFGYCLVVGLSLVAGTPGPRDFLHVQFTGYVAAGTYTGTGTSAPDRAHEINPLLLPRRR